MKELDWPTKSSDLSPIKHFRDEQREPGPLVQHRYLTSPILFWMNGKNCHRNTGNTGNWTSLGHFTCCREGTNQLHVHSCGFRVGCHKSSCWYNVEVAFVHILCHLTSSFTYIHFKYEFPLSFSHSLHCLLPACWFPSFCQSHHFALFYSNFVVEKSGFFFPLLLHQPVSV